jgi:predicted metalloprotease with PDZ domain
MTRLLAVQWFVALLIQLVAYAQPVQAFQEPEPIIYSIKFPDLEKHKAEVTATIPTGLQQSVEVMMPVWSPGFYRVENYANRVESFAATAPGGQKLLVEQPRKNRWKIHTNGSSAITISYRLLCQTRFVTGNWVGEDYAVLNGPSTYITLAEQKPRPHEVTLQLPEKWKKTMTGLEPAGDSKANYYRAANYDVLTDSPIVAGNLTVTECDVQGCKHYLVAFGDTSQWDGERAAASVQQFVQEHRRFWGELPYQRYVFLFSMGRGGGGLEHLNSTLVTMSPTGVRPGRGYLSWLSLVSHEYFHAMNVKRLRPIELGPFDYEKEVRTSSLWVAEGLTSYFGDLLVCRAGLSKPDDYLGQLSGHIQQLQTSPGRLEQTLEQASLEVWTGSMSGVGGKLSYYVKGPVVGFLLDAHIRKLTSGTKSLDDVMRLAYQRYSGVQGFTADQFRETAQDVAGTDLKEWFHRALASTEELDYQEALEWFGLEFTTPDPQKPERKWRLAVKKEATPAQTQRLKEWLEKKKN